LGNLKIIDSSDAKTGKIVQRIQSDSWDKFNKVITNKRILEIDRITIQSVHAGILNEYDETIYADKPEITISNSKIEGKGYGVYNLKGKVNINNSKISVDMFWDSYWYSTIATGIYNECGIVEITESQITSKENADTLQYGIENEAGTVEVKKCKIQANRDGINIKDNINYSETGKVTLIESEISGGWRGIYNLYGEVIIGNSEDDVDINSPVIKGGDYGIDGDFEFYDGIIKGGSSAIGESSNVTVPSGYQTKTSEETDKEGMYYMILEKI